MNGLLRVTVLLVLSGGPLAAADRYDALPAPVRETVKALEQRCVDSRGTSKWDPPLVVKAELSAAGAEDYVLDTAKIDCVGAQAGKPWHAPAGHQVWIWISAGENRWEKPLMQHSHGWNVAARTLTMTVLSAQCKLRNPKHLHHCKQIYHIAHGHLVKVMERLDSGSMTAAALSR